jgi:hypothetical protein
MDRGERKRRVGRWKIILMWVTRGWERELGWRRRSARKMRKTMLDGPFWIDCVPNAMREEWIHRSVTRPKRLHSLQCKTAARFRMKAGVRGQRQADVRSWQLETGAE